MIVKNENGGTKPKEYCINISLESHPFSMKITRYVYIIYLTVICSSIQYIRHFMKKERYEYSSNHKTSTSTMYGSSMHYKETVLTKTLIQNRQANNHCTLIYM